MMQRVMTLMRNVVIAYDTRRLKSEKKGELERQHSRESRTIRIKEYSQQYGCFTLPELRWLFQTLPRWSGYYTYFLLAASTGIRGGELVRLSLGNFDKEYRTITYQVLKPSQRTNEEDMLVERSKMRTVHLDDFVREELLHYLARHCLSKDKNGEYLYVTPWSYTDDDGHLVHNKLFSFKDLQTVTAYWHKIKKKARTAGFDVDRLERQTTNLFTGSEKKTYVWRLHMFRHLATALDYYHRGMDLIGSMHWINHSDPEVTRRYLHSASELGSTPEALAKISWPEITGYLLPHDLEVRC